MNEENDSVEIITGYSKAKTYKHLRNKKDLRILEPVIKDFEARLKALEEKHQKRPRGRPRKKKEE